MVLPRGSWTEPVATLIHFLFTVNINTDKNQGWTKGSGWVYKEQGESGGR